MHKTMTRVASDISGYMIEYCAIYIQSGSKITRIGPTNNTVEAASTIKIPILIMVCEYNQSNNHTLSHVLQYSTKYLSNGSGLLGWVLQHGDTCTVRELIYYMMAYSDCLATNMLIEYVGGQQAINAWLEQRGYTTRLRMSYINFTAENDTFESVGTTTAEELSKLFEALCSLQLNSAYSRLITAVTSTLHLSWVGEKLPENFPGIRGKTGSMIDCPPEHASYLNVAGNMKSNGQQIYFSMCTKGTTSTEVSVEKLKTVVLSRLVRALKSFVNV